MLHQTIPLWEKGQYQSENDVHPQPVLVTYLLTGETKRGAVLICPGGGYEFTSEREAEPVALQFNAAGLHAFVLYYSVAPHKHPQPLFDLSRAMHIIRSNATSWQIEPQQIAVCGFSAGGHLAASLGVHWNRPYLGAVPDLKAGENRPDALILCYPVISAGPAGHQRSFQNLLGPDSNSQLLYEMSLEHHITSNVPPTFLWHTYDDASVPLENSLLFAQGLRAHNVPFELHIYAHGPHGLSLATAETDRGGGNIPHVSGWITLCVEWLQHVFST